MHNRLKPCCADTENFCGLLTGYTLDQNIIKYYVAKRHYGVVVVVLTVAGNPSGNLTAHLMDQTHAHCTSSFITDQNTPTEDEEISVHIWKLHLQLKGVHIVIMWKRS